MGCAIRDSLFFPRLLPISLKTLDLSHNQIRAIDTSTPRLRSLETISLDFNCLTVDKRTLESIGHVFPLLEKLSIGFQEDGGRNQMVSTIEVSDQLFPRLVYLNASGNEMRSLKKLRGNHRIEKLVLHTNCLREIPALVGCEKLTVLDISNNCLLGAGNFSYLLTQSPFLRSIDFSGNSSCFHFNELPINSSDKPLDLVKVEPHSDLCRLSFSNTLYDRMHETYVSIGSPSARVHNQLFVCLVFGVPLPSSFRKTLPAVLRQELEQHADDYLVRALARVCRALSPDTAALPTTQPSYDFNAIICHITLADFTTSASINFACCGSDICMKLLREQDSLQPGDVKVCDLLAESRCVKAKSADVGSALVPITGRVELVSRSSLCLLGIKVKSDTRGLRDPCHLLFADAPLSTNLRRYSEQVKYLPGDGHLVMAIQPSGQAVSVTDTLDFPEKYRSWEYILEENDKIEKLEEKIVPVVKRNSVMMTEYTLSALKVQRDYKDFEEKTANSYLQLFKI